MPNWPMIVLRSPKGWTGPKVVDGLQIEGTFRSHQVPLSDPATHAFAAAEKLAVGAQSVLDSMQLTGDLREALRHVRAVREQGPDTTAE